MARTAKKREGSEERKKTVKRFRDEAFLRRLGAQIKKMRTSKGYSIDRLYLEAPGLNRGTISRVERGLVDPQASTLKRIADTIGVPLWVLMKYE